MALNKYECGQNFSLAFGQLINSLETSNFNFHVLSLLLEYYDYDEWLNLIGPHQPFICFISICSLFGLGKGTLIFMAIN